MPVGGYSSYLYKNFCGTVIIEIIFEGFRWVRSSILVDKPGFGRAESLVFPYLVLGSAYFWLNMFEVQAFGRGSKGFEVQFRWMNLGSSEFEVQPVKFEAIQRLLYLGWIQH